MSLIERVLEQRRATARRDVIAPAEAAWAADTGLDHRELLRRPLDIDLSQHLTSSIVGATFGARDDRNDMPSQHSRSRFAPRDGLATAASVVLDLARLQQAGFVMPGGARSPITEQFGQIKRPLLTNARRSKPGDRLSLIMVTSALPREGKTLCAINLAMSIASEIDTSVLLVDADVRRPEVLQRLGLETRPGLLELLVDRQLRLSDVVLGTNLPKLSILPAGTPNDLSSELLASDAMDSLLLSLAATDPKRVVIFDTPPLLVTTEAKVLASRMGQVVMVVAASTTPRSALKDAFATVAQCPVVMSVLNRARNPPIPLGYGY